MKVLLIVLGVIAAIGLACCAGVFFMGRNVLNAGHEGQAYAEESIKAIATDWDAQVFEGRASDELKQVTSVGGRASTMSTGKQQLGKLVEVGKLNMVGVNTHADNAQGSMMEFAFRCSCKFEKGDAEIRIAVVKSHDKWAVLSFEANPAKTAPAK